mmetsp:Transcript_3437/g.6968  ORF Transcript_3437/g.6968 Transcript_3437/m.6968 type:complete len:313 (+) Transcript_3437:111-1049(+)
MAARWSLDLILSTKAAKGTLTLTSSMLSHSAATRMALLMSSSAFSLSLDEAPSLIFLFIVFSKPLSRYSATFWATKAGYSLVNLMMSWWQDRTTSASSVRHLESLGSSSATGRRLGHLVRTESMMEMLAFLKGRASSTLCLKGPRSIVLTTLSSRSFSKVGRTMSLSCVVMTVCWYQTAALIMSKVAVLTAKSSKLRYSRNPLMCSLKAETSTFLDPRALRTEVAIVQSTKLDFSSPSILPSPSVLRTGRTCLGFMVMKQPIHSAAILLTPSASFSQKVTRCGIISSTYLVSTSKSLEIAQTISSFRDDSTR